MRHCRSCKYRHMDIKALQYCNVVVDKCEMTGNLVITPFFDGFMCKFYISREAAVVIADYAADVHPFDKDLERPETYSDYNMGWNDACDYIRDKLDESMIDAAPTVDSVPVVRCKDCKHFMFSDCYGECGAGRLGIVNPDDYCSRGEWKINLPTNANCADQIADTPKKDGGTPDAT